LPGADHGFLEALRATAAEGGNEGRWIKIGYRVGTSVSGETRDEEHGQKPQKRWNFCPSSASAALADLSESDAVPATGSGAVMRRPASSKMEPRPALLFAEQIFDTTPSLNGLTAARQPSCAPVVQVQLQLNPARNFSNGIMPRLDVLVVLRPLKTRIRKADQ